MNKPTTHALPSADRRVRQEGAPMSALDNATRRQWLGLAAAAAAGLAGCGGGASQNAVTAIPAPAPAPIPSPAPTPSPVPNNVGMLRVGWAQSVNATTTQIVSTRADGSDRQVTKSYTGIRVPIAPKWSPDGRRIAFFSATEGSVDGYALFVMDADGSNERQVAAGAQGSLDWREDSRHLAYCPLSVASVDLAGFTGLTVRNGTVRVVDTFDGRVVYARGGVDSPPVLTGGPPSHPAGFFHHPLWDGPNGLFVMYQNETLTAVESVPAQLPPVYTGISQSGRYSVDHLNISLPNIGDASPISELLLPRDSTLLARSPASGALVLWQSGNSKGFAESALLWVEGGSVITLAVDPALRFDRAFSFTPDGAQCTWDGQLYDTSELLVRGVAGAPVRAQVAGSPLSWFLAP